MSKYFSIEELCASETAQKYKIDNTPDEQQKKNLEDLMAVLDGIREALGKPINITSGFRSESLNKKVGGVATSEHRLGLAADCQVKNMTNKELGYFIKGYLQGSNQLWDQIIIEKSGRSE